MDIHTAFYESPIGILEIHSDGENINGVLFTDTIKNGNRPVPAPLNQQIPPPLVSMCITQLTEYFDGKRQVFTLPLQQQGTPFQQNVWAALLNIPFGKTSSYLSLSKNIDNVKAIRATGNANGRNNISIIVPCHRVIGSNGKLVGYGGDLWRKKWLLQHENKYANGVQILFKDLQQQT